LLIIGLIPAFAQNENNVRKANDYEVAAYYFPNYHVDPFNEKTHGKGWTEWELVKSAKPRFKDHQQPKKPKWGYFDESDSKVAAKEIDLAVQHGIDVCIYDWYWYQAIKGKKFLHGGLEDSFLKAVNNTKMKFALMWANHDWMNIEPTSYTNVQEKLADGELTEEAFERMTDYIINTYFKKPNYWTIDGKPYFSAFDAVNFITGLGGIENAKQALKKFEQKTIKAGFKGLHVNFIDQNVTNALMKSNNASRKDVITQLRISSLTSYNFLHAYDLSKAPFPKADYLKAVEANIIHWSEITREIAPLTYFPNVTMGWDVTPRLIQTDKFDSFRGYPWTPVFSGDNTPAAFEKALLSVKNFI
jgi:hypothetical protein